MQRVAVSFLVVIGIVTGFFGTPLVWSTAGEPLPSFSFVVPASEADREYLRLEKEPGTPFEIPDMKADIVIIELLSMYCPYCQSEAPLINTLADLAMAEQENGITIRVLGIGASNTEFEVGFFRDNFSVSFPIFPDQSLEIYDKLKGEGTPGFVAVSMKSGQKPTIVYRQAGGFHDPREFLDLVLTQAGYK